MKLFLFLVLMFSTVVAFTQPSPCDGIDSVKMINGKWKKVNEDIVSPDKTYARGQHKLLTKRIDSIFSLIKEALPNLHGVEPRWYRSIRGDSYLPNGAVPYALECFFLEYYCNTNYKKVMLGDETGHWIRVFVNRMSWFFYDVDTMRINDDGKLRRVYQIPKRVGKIGDFHVYEQKQSEWFMSRCIVIGRNGVVPWRALTRKEYLTGLKNNYEGQVIRFAGKGSWEQDYRNKLKYINDYLATASEEDLAKIVIIDPKVGIWGFKGKFGDEEHGGFRLVLSAFNDKYFDKDLPRHVPQLMQIFWTYESNETGQMIREQFEKNLPVKQLQSMIDK